MTATATQTGMRPAEIVNYYLLYLATSLVIYLIGNSHMQMTLLQTYQLVAVVAITVLGGYQLYFWVQRYTQQHKTAVILEVELDNYIPFIPETIIVYSPLYYFTFALVVTDMASYQQLIAKIFAALVLLSLQVLCFYCLPSTVPDSYRTILNRGYQARDNIVSKAAVTLLQYVQTIDEMHNACPSAHCSFAVLLAYMIYDSFPIYASLFPVMIAISCLTTKQHVLLDVVPGMLLGYVVAYLLL